MPETTSNAMVNLFEGPELLDPMLTQAIGPVDAVSVAAIAGVCNDAVTAVLGASIIAELATDSARRWLVVPWVKDLARGLQLRSVKGPIEVQTTSLLRMLSGDRMSEDDLQRAGSSIDIAVALQLGDVLEQVLGPGATQRLPSENEARLTWIETLKLGYHVHLVLEFLRLLPSSS
jgi:hypothetical protein